MRNTSPPFRTTFLALICLGGLVPAAWAADYSDPTWPCIQRKVERLSVGIMWPQPIAPVTLPPKAEADVVELVGRLVLRRVEVETLEPVIEKFVADHGSDPKLLGHIFSETFDRMAQTRSQIMTGIGEYSLKQIALSEKIDAARAEMSDILKAETPDYDRIDRLEEQLDWDERIYTDRRQSLIYVCETPVIIEKRLYAIAQMLLAHIPG